MKSKLKAVLIAGGAIALVLLLVMIVLLYVEMKKRSNTASKVESLYYQLHSMYARDPFPNTENVAAVSKNGADLEQELLNLLKRMGAGQIKLGAGTEPLEWVTMLTSIKETLVAEAAARQIDLPANFWFGFDKYEDGRPPSTEEVPRLAHQLKVIKALSDLLYNSGVKSLIDIKRVEFEEEVITKSSGRKRAAQVKDEFAHLYAVEPFKVEFAARETAFVNVLNSIVSNRVFMIVTKVECRAEAGVGEATIFRREQYEDRMDAQAALTALMATKPADDRSHDERILSGRSVEKPARYIIDIDVYRFEDKPGEREKQPADSAAEAGSKT